MREKGVEWSGGEQYAPLIENPFIAIRDLATAMSTFSIDVDTASYANVRRFLTQRQLPPPDAVRIEELVNYFKYDDPVPTGDVPLAIRGEVAQCPWNPAHRLVRISLRGRDLDARRRPPSNLVFLLDVSGSMADENKLPLVKQAMRLLVGQLTENDRVAIVVYAGDSGVALPSTSGDQKQKILAAIDSLQSGGSTNGEGGIRLAYQMAVASFIKSGANRVILATDGDFNVGISDDNSLEVLIKEQAASGVYLTALGFGMGNLKDAKLERLADRGNGNYAYVDNLREARKVLVEQASGTLFTIAKDVKLQLEFNPAVVQSFRLIGYENRMLAHEDFQDDRKDAGEVGAGHTVTALYEIVPAATAQAQADDRRPAADGKDGGKDGGNQGGEVLSRYQAAPARPSVALTDAAKTGELLSVRLRYKPPTEDRSKLVEVAVKDSSQRFSAASADLRFSASVAAFGMLLGGSKQCGNATLDGVLELAQGALGNDPGGYRAEFIDLVRQTKQLVAERKQPQPER